MIDSGCGRGHHLDTAGHPARVGSQGCRPWDHVVADKSFAPTAAAARELVSAAEGAGVLLSVFHNRRWDADIRTLQMVLREQRLGDIWRFDSRFDTDDPVTLERGPEGGLLRDIGSHLVDQALWLCSRFSMPPAPVQSKAEWSR